MLATLTGLAVPALATPALETPALIVPDEIAELRAARWLVRPLDPTGSPGREAPERRPASHWALLGGTITAAAAGGMLFGLSLQARQDFDQARRASELDAAQRRVNTLTWASYGCGATAIGGVIGFALLR